MVPADPSVSTVSVTSATPATRDKTSADLPVDPSRPVPLLDPAPMSAISDTAVTSPTVEESTSDMAREILTVATVRETPSTVVRDAATLPPSAEPPLPLTAEPPTVLTAESPTVASLSAVTAAERWVRSVDRAPSVATVTPLVTALEASISTTVAMLREPETSVMFRDVMLTPPESTWTESTTET